jgi:hypothetical protein
MSLSIAALALQGPATPDLGWLSGYWLSCEGGREVSETWSDARGGNLLGTGMTTDGGKVSFEQSRIGRSGAGYSFFAQPGGQPPAEFPLARMSPRQVTFENPRHDFPQRVIYRLQGKLLIARIEGRIDDGERAVEWRYRRAPLNSRCPR